MTSKLESQAAAVSLPTSNWLKEAERLADEAIHAYAEWLAEFAMGDLPSFHTDRLNVEKDRARVALLAHLRTATILMESGQTGTDGSQKPNDADAIRSAKAGNEQLMRFYGVASLAALVDAQARHVEKLQAKLPPTPNVFAPQRVREG